MDEEKTVTTKGTKCIVGTILDVFFDLPADWFYVLNKHGEGMAVRFPIKAKAVLSWTPSRFVPNNGTLEPAQRIPLEKIIIDFRKRACNIDNI